MSSFRPLGQFIQYFLDDGQVNAGGSVTFYETDLTTLKNTYSDPALTVLNSNPVTLAADGRLSADVWGSGVYGAVLKDASGTVIETRNNIQSGADPGFSIPALVASEFLTNDGSNLLWQAIQQVPDPTGSAGDILGTDGTLVFWQSLATLNIPVITPGASSLKIGTVLIQWGSASVAASGTNTANATVFFSPAFSGTPYHISVTPNTGSGITSAGKLAIMSAQARTAASFQAWIDVNNDPGDPPISAATPFTWLAIGPA